MKRENLIALFLLTSICIFYSCQKLAETKQGDAVLELPATAYAYDTTINNNIPTIGRVLFYDTRMSANNSVSCATCHQQARAFADNVSFSTGFQGAVTTRNSMPIQNLTSEFNGDGGIVEFSGTSNSDPSNITSDTLSLFWDGRVKLLKAMVLRPIVNHVEMGITDLDALALKIGKIPDYQNLFEKAYGSPVVNEEKIADALSQFLTYIRADNSRFDLMQRGQIQFSAIEQEGMNLFTSKYTCNNCHRVDALNGYQLGGGFVNIGLDLVYKDIGAADVTGNNLDIGKFKIPTLRNVALTAPYMHDGRFNELDDVLEHYSSGILNHPNLDVRLKNGNTPIKMNIPDADKRAIIVFLNTLTDYNMITDPKFSNPFVTK